MLSLFFVSLRLAAVIARYWKLLFSKVLFPTSAALFTLLFCLTNCGKQTPSRRFLGSFAHLQANLESIAIGQFREMKQFALQFSFPPFSRLFYLVTRRLASLSATTLLAGTTGSTTAPTGATSTSSGASATSSSASSSATSTQTRLGCSKTSGVSYI